MRAKASKRALAVVLGAVVLGAVALMAGATASASRPPHFVQSDASGAAGSWAELAPTTSPSARVASIMSFDQKTGQMVLYGGIGTTGPSSGTWAWDGTEWSLLHPAVSPSSRSSAAVAYDPASGQLLLFGGFAFQAGGPGFFSGTWAWDGTDWSLLHPATSPPPLAGAAMAYDPSTRQVVLFGGAGAKGPVSATWAWDGTDWSQLSPSTNPPALSGASMAYDPASGQVVLFGGSGTQGASSATWAWDGTDWSQLSPSTSPPALSGASMAYDPASGQVVLFGGVSVVNGKQNFSAGTWAWDGTDWSQLSPSTSPPALSGASMAYDPAMSELVLFGGGGAHGDFSATWVYKAPLAPGTTTTQPQATTTTTSATTTTAPTSSTSTAAPTSSQPNGTPGRATSTTATHGTTTTTTTTAARPPVRRGQQPLPHLVVLARNATGDGTVYLGVPAKVYGRIMAQHRWEGRSILLVRSQAVVVVVVGAKH